MSEPKVLEVHILLDSTNMSSRHCEYSLQQDGASHTALLYAALQGLARPGLGEVGMAIFYRLLAEQVRLMAEGLALPAECICACVTPALGHHGPT